MRNVEVRVKLEPSIAAQLTECARVRGVLPATLSALVLGEYLEKQRRELRLTEMIAHDAAQRMVEAAAAGSFELSPESAEVLARAFSASTEGGAGGIGSSAAPEAAAPAGVSAPAGAPGGDRVRSAA